MSCGSCRSCRPCPGTRQDERSCVPPIKSTQSRPSTPAPAPARSAPSARARRLCAAPQAPGPARPAPRAWGGAPVPGARMGRRWETDTAPFRASIPSPSRRHSDGLGGWGESGRWCRADGADRVSSAARRAEIRPIRPKPWATSAQPKPPQIRPIRPMSPSGDSLPSVRGRSGHAKHLILSLCLCSVLRIFTFHQNLPSRRGPALAIVSRF